MNVATASSVRCRLPMLVTAFATAIVAHATPVEAQTGQQRPSGEIRADFRGTIVYKGYLEGAAIVPMGGNQRGLNGLLNGLLNTQTVPLSGGVQLDVQYYGDRFQGVTVVNSDVPGLSGRSSFSGVRRGTTCEWVADDGHRGVSSCSFDAFLTRQAYTNNNGQKISTFENLTMMSVDDIGAKEARQAAAAAAQAAQAAEKKAREDRLDAALERGLKPH